MNVGPNDATITVVDNSTGVTTTHAVAPGKDTQVQIPNVPGGTYLTVEVGKGPTRRVFIVEVIAPGP